MNNGKRRIVQSNNLVVQPSVESLIADALNVIQQEITKFSYKVNKGQTLAPGEARIFQGYIKSLTDMAKESREAAKHEDLGDMTNDEIIRTLAAGREKEVADLLLSGKVAEKEKS